MLERDFQRKVMKRLTAPNTEQGGVWISVPRTQFGKAGVSDLVFASAAIELKAPGSRYDVTAAQQAFLDRVNRNGGFARAVKSFDDLEGFIHDFRAFQETRSASDDAGT